jgi:DNA-binding MarR family transcriptional regulator
MHPSCEHEMSLIVQLSKIQFQLIHQFLASIDMYPGQYHLLNLLSQYEDGLNQKEIGKNLFIKPSSVNQILVKLEKMNYITRTIDSSDKRVLIVTITPSGKEILEKGKEKISHIQNLMKEGISEEDLTQFEKVALVMKENLLRERNGEPITCH